MIENIRIGEEADFTQRNNCQSDFGDFEN